jgi:hypothetical protein
LILGGIGLQKSNKQKTNGTGVQTMRDRLIELIRQAKKSTKGANCDLEREMLFADYLLANGVIVPPCKVGDVVYRLEEKCKYSGEENKPWDSCRQYWDNVFKNKMWGCAGKDENGNPIYCKQEEMVWYVKEVEYSLLLYSNSAIVLGENLFLTKDEAEEKLKELSKDENK